MDNTIRNDAFISGKYRHFKGQYYILFCIAFDNKGEKYVLYRQCYGDESFWIRPYNMFFESVQDDKGTIVPRFSPTNAKREKANNKIKLLVDYIEKQTITIRNSENEEEYVITVIDETANYVEVCPVNYNDCSGYLTDFELLSRLDYIGCRINGQIRLYKSHHKICDTQKLVIGKNNIDLLKQQINPCSIDLQIADSGFICTKRRLIDPQSVETISTAESLWKPARVYKSKHGPRKYIKLQPGKTILTHTKEKLRIPFDCAAKIEIKSTFARLSLDITSGDFCNPGYYGYFPFEITNKGKHTIILHQSETMAQLMLIPLRGPILENYIEKATFKDEHGFDDGTPFSFWRERAIKALRRDEGTQTIVDLYIETREAINSETVADVNETKQRFDDGFLSFCQKRIERQRFKNINGQPDSKTLFRAYCKSETLKQKFFSFKWVTGALSLLSIVLQLVKSFFLQLPPEKMNLLVKLVLQIPLWAYLSVFFSLLLVTIVLFVLTPRIFCTFEKMDIEKLCEKAERKHDISTTDGVPSDVKG